MKQIWKSLAYEWWLKPQEWIISSEGIKGEKSQQSPSKPRRSAPCWCQEPAREGADLAYVLGTRGTDAVAENVTVMPHVGDPAPDSPQSNTGSPKPSYKMTFRLRSAWPV